MSIVSQIDPALLPLYGQFPERDDPPLPAEVSAPYAREGFAALMAPYNANPDERVARRDALAPGPADRPEGVPLRIYEPADRDGSVLPVALHVHGGAFILGTLDDYDFVCERLVADQGIVVVAVDYRVAPEHRFPAHVDDCYAALRWLHGAAAELGADPDSIVLTGESAGATICAGLALMARDRGEVPVAFQMLTCPALDDRMETPSAREIVDLRVVDRAVTLSAWAAYLGREPGEPDTSPYAAPSRAADLAGLPPAFVAVGQLDPMRDECVEYASRLMQAGVPTELHVWPGAFHGFEMLGDAPVSQDAKEARVRAWKRALAPRG